MQNKELCKQEKLKSFPILLSNSVMDAVMRVHIQYGRENLI